MRNDLVLAICLTGWFTLSSGSPALASDTNMLELGRTVFTQKAAPACAICHTLADAGSSGAIGPDLDELKPSKETVLKVLKEGMGVMPSFAETLSQEDMEAVASYVEAVTHGQ